MPLQKEITMPAPPPPSGGAVCPTQGFCVPPVGYRVITDEDLSSAGKSKGDFKEDEVGGRS